VRRSCADPSNFLPSHRTTLLHKKMPFAQLVIGPPGSGKSTYCDGMQQFMGAIERKCSVVNLDPANDHTSYQPAIDVRDLVTIDEIMEQESLGPNGGVLFALEELEHNFEWLEEGLKELGGMLLTLTQT
jgi:GPN-loop GTPase